MMNNDGNTAINVDFAATESDPAFGRPLVSLAGFAGREMFAKFSAICRAHKGKFWPGSKQWSVDVAAMDAFREAGFELVNTTPVDPYAIFDKKVV